MQEKPTYVAAMEEREPGVTLFELGAILSEKKTLIAWSVSASTLIGLVTAFLMPSWYTATTVLLPPQQQQSAAVAAISQLGALAGVAGGLSGLKSPADQYVALMQSVTVTDRLIDRFKLQDVYGEKYRQDARKALKENVRITIGKRDGLISVEVDDRVPSRAAEMANMYVTELRNMTTALAVSEAQQRRLFFEQQLAQTKVRLDRAQTALAESGISQGALKVEPRTAAENYARLSAQVTAAEVKLFTLRRMLAENTPEIQQQQAALNALRDQVLRIEKQGESHGNSDYVNRYREFKYQEAIFEIFVKQYELARVDESREGALIQVVDIATPPERRAGPKRALIALAAAFTALFASCAFVVGRAVFSR